MGRFTDAINWGKKFLRRETTTAALTDTASYAYETINYAFKQAAALPAVVRSLVTHAPTRTVVGHLSRVAFFDVLPKAVLHYGMYYANQRLPKEGADYIRSYYNDPSDNDAWLTPEMVIQAMQAGILVVGTTVWFIRKNREIDQNARMTIVNAEASHLLTGDRVSATMTDCGAHCQSGLKGPLSSIAGYWTAYAAISLVGNIPYIGSPVAAVLGFYHNGQFILSLALPELCNDHLSTYFRENHELVLSLGLGHKLISSLAARMVEHLTGVPSFKYVPAMFYGEMVEDFYDTAIKELIMIFQVMVVVHLTLPPAQRTSVRTRTPVLLLEDGVDLGIEVIIEGVKKVLARRMNGRKLELMMTPLHLETLKTLFVSLHKNQLMQLFLPSMLEGTKAFTLDPIVKSSWTVIQPITVNALKNIESLPDYWAVWLASCIPNVTGVAVEAVSGAPKPVTKLLLRVITEGRNIEQIRRFRYQVELLQVAAPTPIRGEQMMPLLPGQTIPQISVAAKPHVLLDSSSSPTAKDVIRKDDHIAPPALPQAAKVIRFPIKAAPARTDNIPSAKNVIRYRFHTVSPAPTVELDEDDWVRVAKDDCKP